MPGLSDIIVISTCIQRVFLKVTWSSLLLKDLTDKILRFAQNDSVYKDYMV